MSTCDYVTLVEGCYNIEEGWQVEQHVYIKFGMKVGKSAVEALEMLLRAFGKNCLGWIQVFEWCAMEEPAVTNTREGTTSLECSEVHDDFSEAFFI